MIIMKTMWSIACGLAFAVPVFAQDIPPSMQRTQVTFYTRASSIKSGLPGHELIGFNGKLFEADHRLLSMQPGHFISFTFAPGQHVFSAAPWFAKHAKSGVHLSLDLVEGENRFVELMFVGTATSSQIRLKEVTCEGATRDNTINKPLDRNHLFPEGAAIATSSTEFPSCS
jgi:hypothetical protein